MTNKRKRGAPKGNQNAKKNPEDRRRKQYIQVFGQRWDVNTGNQILSYLKRLGLTQKAFLVKVISEYILNKSDRGSDV